MSENLLIPLPGFTLPPDFPWRVGFIAAVDGHLRRMRATGHYEPARFFGYYFQGSSPVGLSGSWTVALEESEHWNELGAALEQVTRGRFSIRSAAREAEPDFMRVHDRRDGACWLWGFAFGLRFAAATEAVAAVQESGGGDEATGGGGGPEQKLLGP